MTTNLNCIRPATSYQLRIAIRKFLQGNVRRCNLANNTVGGEGKAKFAVLLFHCKRVTLTPFLSRKCLHNIGLKARDIIDLPEATTCLGPALAPSLDVYAFLRRHLKICSRFANGNEHTFFLNSVYLI